MPYAVVNGSKVFFVSKGSRGDQVILFIHGAGGNHRRWWPLISKLSDRHLMVAVDLPGHGQSEGAVLDSINAYREWVDQFLHWLGIPRRILVGHSMGGGVALDYALCYPDSLQALVLIGTGARLRVAASIMESLRQGIVASDFCTPFYSIAAPTELLDAARQELSTVPAEVYLQDFIACDAWDAMGRLDTVQVPALIICGEEDRMTPLKFSTYLQAHLPLAELAAVPLAGHMVILEKPAEVAGMMENFLAALPCRND